MTIWKSGLPNVRSSPCLPLPLKVMPIVHPTMTIVAAQLGMVGCANEQSGQTQGSETQGAAMSEETNNAAAPLTVVLVHGAFADASGWNDVVEQLQAEGVQVTAPANPLRGISIDSPYIASVLDQIPGPVLAVGHSYGGGGVSNPPPHPQQIL